MQKFRCPLGNDFGLLLTDESSVLFVKCGDKSEHYGTFVAVFTLVSEALSCGAALLTCRLPPREHTAPKFSRSVAGGTPDETGEGSA